MAWIRITSGAAGTGDGTVRYDISRNDTPAERTATLTIAGLPFTVTQEAGRVENVELSGRLADLAGGCPAITFTLDKQTVRTNAATVFSGRPCAQLERNVRVEVTGIRQSDGSVLANRVVVERD